MQALLLTVDHGLNKVAHLGHADLDVEALALLRDEVHRAGVLLRAAGASEGEDDKKIKRRGNKTEWGQ